MAGRYTIKVSKAGVNYKQPEIDEARILYIYGDHDGTFYRKIPELSKKVGIHVATLRKHVQGWQDELEEIMIKKTELEPLTEIDSAELSVAVSSGDYRRYKEDAEFIREAIDKCKKDIEACEDSAEWLRDQIDKFDFSPLAQGRLVRMIEAFLKSSGGRMGLEKHLLTLEKTWVQVSGIEDKMDVILAAEKERTRLRVKKAEMETPAPPPEEKKKKKKAGGIFDI